LGNKHYVIVDIETTGLSKNKHHIIEIAAVLFDGEKIIKTFQTLINPQTHIPSFITNLTGINNIMTQDAPTIKEALPDFLDFLGNHILVAHNATFDYGFLNHHWLKHFERPINNPTLCTRKLANRLVPELPSKRLEYLCQHFNITNERAHRAMEDVMVTVKILENFIHILKERRIEEKFQIIEFQNKPLHKT